MRFSFHVLQLPKTLTITLFIINMFRHVKFLVIEALQHLGIYKQHPQEILLVEEEESPVESHVFIFNGSSISLVPIPIKVVTAAIKKRVPVIVRCQEDDEMLCTICLETIDFGEEMRELCNCNHMFHRECLDTWVDAGHINCPLCRSILLPPPPKSNTSVLSSSRIHACF